MSDLINIGDLVLQSYQISILTLSVIVRLFVSDHIMCSEFIGVGRYLYQLPISDTIVLVVISPVSYFRCQILVVSYSVVRYQLSVVSCQIIS